MGKFGEFDISHYGSIITHRVSVIAIVGDITLAPLSFVVHVQRQPFVSRVDMKSLVEQAACGLIINVAWSATSS